ncbi:universal stress protein [Altererythrobacter lauratis]|uniref:Universal stress protein n=1 Tax=Alteraurantiacibacter lauratis TaxID=2054627 RepID=A0ABV7EFB4_9SPHN
MNLQSIMLFAPAESSVADRGPSAYAIAIARAHNARLTIFVVNLDVTTPGREADPRQVAAGIGDAAAEAGVDHVTITEHSHAIGIHEVVAEHARHHDCTILGSGNLGVLTEKILIEHLLFFSGRPLVVVPQDYRGGAPQGVTAVAWDNTPAAARALGDAKPMIGDRPMVFLTIDGDKQLQGDLSGDKIIAAAERRGLNASAASAERGSRNIADALQQESKALGADLLVMGGYGHSTLRRIVLGSATASILNGPRMPVLLSH